MSVNTSQIAEWKIHTGILLQEIAGCSNQSIYRIPLHILGCLLSKVGERAAEINDPKLNALMCQLTIYTIADPYSQDYNPTLVNDILTAKNISKEVA